MSLLAELNSIIAGLGLPVETGVFSVEAPEKYIVLTPLSDIFELDADDRPRFDIQEVRISLFCKGNYNILKNSITTVLLDAEITITARKYMGHEDDSNYHHVVFNVEKEYAI